MLDSQASDSGATSNATQVLQPYAQMFTHSPSGGVDRPPILRHTHSQDSQSQPHHPHIPHITSTAGFTGHHTSGASGNTVGDIDDDDSIMAASIGGGSGHGGIDDDLEAILPSNTSSGPNSRVMGRRHHSFANSGIEGGTVNTAELTSISGGNKPPSGISSHLGNHFSHLDTSTEHGRSFHGHNLPSHQQQQHVPPSTSYTPTASIPAHQPSHAHPSNTTGLSEDKSRALETLLVKFWTRQMDLAERGTSNSNTINGQTIAGATNENTNSSKENVGEFKHFALPLARIKKVMKSDPEVKMISAEVPVLLGKCCESESCLVLDKTT